MQYWCTEYRAAVCAVLAGALWNHWRDSVQPGQADLIRKRARATFGAGIARRWFN